MQRLNAISELILHTAANKEHVFNTGKVPLKQIVPSLNILKNFLRSISLLQSDGEDELKKRQLMELAIINGTYRDSSSKNSSRKSQNLAQWMNVLDEISR